MWPVWTGVGNPAFTGVGSPDREACIESYRLRYPIPYVISLNVATTLKANLAKFEKLVNDSDT
jgi:hypothetical protein